MVGPLATTRYQWKHEMNHKLWNIVLAEMHINITYVVGPAWMLLGYILMENSQWEHWNYLVNGINFSNIIFSLLNISFNRIY